MDADDTKIIITVLAYCQEKDASLQTVLIFHRCTTQTLIKRVSQARNQLSPKGGSFY